MNRQFPLLTLWLVMAVTLVGCHSLRPSRCVLPVPTSVPAVSAAPSVASAVFPPELSEYQEEWGSWVKEAPATPPNPEVRTALPPRPSALAFPPENYTSTFPKLLFALARNDLPQEVRAYLELLALAHQQQTILSEIYHAVDDLQHAKNEALNDLLDAARRLQEFQKKYHVLLQDPNAAAVARETAPWLDLWKGRDPLAVLPSLWNVTTELTNAKLHADDAHTAVRFSALYDERPVATNLPEELKKHRKLWLHQDFATPIVAAGRCAFLILPALPRAAKLILNGKSLSHPHSGAPALIPLTAELLGDAPTQHLAICLPTKAIGEALLPICLAAGQKQ